jgi:hypothetical protein
MSNDLKKWKIAKKKSIKTEKNALLFTKYRLGKCGWRCADFQSKRGHARTGIVDMVAIKIDKKDKDKLKIMLLQVKGGSARVKDKEKIRLEKAIKKVEVAFNCAEKPEKTVLFDWEPTDEQFDLHAT